MDVASDRLIVSMPRILMILYIVSKSNESRHNSSLPSKHDDEVKALSEVEKQVQSNLG